MSLLSFTSLTLDLDDVAELGEGAYLTDGASLFRVVRPFAPPDGEVVLEDCMTLEQTSYAAADLWDLCVRLVSPAASPDQATDAASPGQATDSAIGPE
jgi:hypothetical protein